MSMIHAKTHLQPSASILYSSPKDVSPKLGDAFDIHIKEDNRASFTLRPKMVMISPPIIIVSIYRHTNTTTLFTNEVAVLGR